ncbi:hypothetical protein GCM10025859_06230 [Alicyclobacillus fastidiosus]|nr:hypothetical protein GCM10025859_06230 [Alicyclobacillus fastidiosus]
MLRDKEVYRSAEKKMLRKFDVDAIDNDKRAKLDQLVSIQKTIAEDTARAHKFADEIRRS